MKEQVHEDPRIVRAAEQSMRRWTWQQAHGHAAHVGIVAKHKIAIGPYITISREAGAGGSEIGRILGEKLGWEVLDKNVLDQMADRYHLSKEMLKLIDETPGSWVFDVLGAWMDPALVPHERYLIALGRVALAAARRGRVVVVGRGSRFLLPPDAGLAVRIIAPLAYRIDHIMRERGLTTAEARTWVERTERERREFVRKYFHRDVADTHLYDLTINVDRIGTLGAVELIRMAVGEEQHALNPA
jgi:cytidylate kinase